MKTFADFCMVIEEELSLEEQFDEIEDAVENIAKNNNVDSELIWEYL